MLELLQLANAVKILYEYGFEIQEQNFVELTDVQYRSLIKQGYDASKRWYRLTKGIFEYHHNSSIEMPIASEEEIPLFKKAVRLIYKMSDESGQKFSSFQERLDYLKKFLPDVMTTSSKGE